MSDVFDRDVKNIQTLRFQEFLDQRPTLEQQMYSELNDQELFSFRSNDSYSLLVEGRPIIKARPQNVPPLDFNALPAYESSSDEEQDQENYQ